MSDRDAALREAQRLDDEHGASDPYAAAIRATRMPIVITDATLPDNPIVFVNKAFVDLSGYPREEIIGRNCRFMQGPDTNRADVASISDAIAAGESVAVDVLNYRKDGAAFWNALYVSPVFDEARRITHFFGSQVDVTERNRSAEALREANGELERAKTSAEALVAERTSDLQRALDQKTALLHEVDHRVKNNLQLISSLILLQSRRIADPQTRRTVTSMLERVSALATVHRNLFQSEDVSTFEVPTFVRTIANDLLDSTGRDDIRLDFDMEPVVTTAAHAAPIALVVNELLTNALRHAFPAQGGRIRFGVARRDDALSIEVEDDGVGRGEPSGRPAGFGSSLIELLVKQLSAQIERRDATPGTYVRLTIPAVRPAGPDDVRG